MGDYKKSLYLFLTAVLGVLMFLMLDRIVVFFYLYLLAGNYLTSSLTYLQFNLVDYFTLTIVMMLGAWYGIWLGLYWYKKIYEEKSHPGAVGHIAEHYFPQPRPRRADSLADLKQRVAADLYELESLAPAAPVTMAEPITMPAPAPIKRKLVRKKAPRVLAKAPRPAAPKRTAAKSVTV